MNSKAKGNDTVAKKPTKKIKKPIEGDGERRLGVTNNKKLNPKIINISQDSTKRSAERVTSVSIITESGKVDIPILQRDALPDWIGDIVASVCENSEIHPAAALTHLLLRLSGELIGPLCMRGGVALRPIVNAVIAGASSASRIGMSYDCVARIFEEVPDSTKSVSGHLQSGEQLVRLVAVNSKGNMPSVGSYNNFEQHSEERRLVFLENEFRAMMNIAKRDGNSLAPIITSLFENGSAELFSKPDMRVTNAHVIIVAHTTSIDYSRLLNAVQAGNGFFSRFLWILVQRPKLAPKPKSMGESDIERFRNIIAQRIEFARGLGKMVLGEKAGKLWREIYPELTKDIPGVVGAVVQHSDVLVLRLAMIYALAAGRSMIMKRDMRAAYALVSYSMESARIMFKGTEPITVKEKILQGLRSAPDQEMSRTKISTDIFKGNKPSGVIKKVITEMKGAGLIEITSTKTSGRSKEIIRLVE